MPLSQAIAQLLRRFASAENILSLEAAIIAGDRPRTVALAREIWQAIIPQLNEAFGTDLTAKATRAYNAAWNRLPGDGYPDPSGAIDRASRAAGRRVTAMTSQGRRVINRLVTAAISGGAGNPRLAATLVATGLGMNAPQARAHVKLSAALAGRVREGTLTQDRALRRLEADRKRKIRRRARTIARTETSDARGYARQRAWSDAARTGKIKAKDWVKVWHTSNDDLVDDVCIPLDGATAPINGAFFDGTRRTPRHPNCRCTITLRRKR